MANTQRKKIPTRAVPATAVTSVTMDDLKKELNLLHQTLTNTPRQDSAEGSSFQRHEEAHRQIGRS